MATIITDTIGVEWQVNNGALAGEHALEEPPVDLNNVNGVIEPNDFQWPDATARLIGGPEQLVDQWVQARVYKDTRTQVISDDTGEIVSDTVARTYLPYSVSEMTFGSDFTNDWVDETNPAKPKQYSGPILYKHNDLEAPLAIPAGGYTRVGVDSFNAAFCGFVLDNNALPETPGTLGDVAFLINITTGMGYIWADSVPGLGAGYRWVNSGLAKDPGEINTNALASIDDLPDDAPDGQWQVVSTGVYGTVYFKTPEGWMNIGPIQGGGPVVVIPETDKKRYVSGYMYSLVFDQSRFRYVPRLSGETQSTYEGEISINQTGWFPDSPHDPDRDIYPMDSVTRVKPDGREMRTVTYTCTFTSDLASDTCTILQDVYQPTYNWGDLIQQLLELTYFYHGIYH